MSETNRETNIPEFIGELDAGVFENKLSAVLNDVAKGVMNTRAKGEVTIKLSFSPMDENRVKISHKLTFVIPTPRGKTSEEDTTETPMYVNRGGKLTILPEDQGQLFDIKGQPVGRI